MNELDLSLMLYNFLEKKQMIVSDLYGCIEQFAPTRL